MNIQVRGITKAFGALDVLRDANLEVLPGELVALSGPRESGKTTLLRIIGGLETADGGSVYYGKDNVTRSSVRERDTGFVFQHYGLFNHMTVFENIALSLRLRRWTKQAVQERVCKLLQLIQLESAQDHYPSELSEGQQQCVILARALAPEPQVLLLDEPIVALHPAARQELHLWLRRLHDELRLTSIFVTRDQEEAFEVADRVAVLSRGRVEQIKTFSQRGNTALTRRVTVGGRLRPATRAGHRAQIGR